MTKAEELNLLAEIDGLIWSAGENSYIHDTFAGIVDVCKANIENDWANSPVRDLTDERMAHNADERRLDMKKKELDAMQKMCKEALDEVAELRKRIKQVEDERDAMCDSVDGLGEIIDEQEKKIRMYETEIAQYARGDVFAELRLNQTRRVVAIRGLYEKFCVGTQKHITENASCTWDYMTNGWKWEDAEYCNDEDDVWEVFRRIVIAERGKECGK